MRLLIDDTFATSTFTTPIRSGWTSPSGDVTAELVAGIGASSINGGDAALISSAAVLALQQSHGVLPGIAVVADAIGAVAMRTPVRPDEVESTAVRLLDASGAAELLARATVRPFYGIDATRWIRDDDVPEAARAEVVVVEGAEALREPEGGFSEDLTRAWFILTARPVVSHILLLPRDLALAKQRDLLAYLDAVKTEGLVRRREWRPALADREGISRERSNAFWAGQRLNLEMPDRQALLELLRQGARGTSNPSPSNVTFIDGDDAM